MATAHSIIIIDTLDSRAQPTTTCEGFAILMLIGYMKTGTVGLAHNNYSRINHALRNVSHSTAPTTIMKHDVHLYTRTVIT